MTSVTVTGTEPLTIDDRRAGKTLEKAGRDFDRWARAELPRDTGRLATSWSMTRSGIEAEIISSAPYAEFVEAEATEAQAQTILIEAGERIADAFERQLEK